jgi:hypothetical protein
MVTLGLANSRMKDYYDVWMLLRTFQVDPGRLRQAIKATFDRRGTPVPTTVPEGLSEAFAVDASKQLQWQAFAGNLLTAAPGLRGLITELRTALAPFIGE